MLTSVENFAQSYQGGQDNGPHVVGVNLGVARGLTNGVPGQYSIVDGTANYRPLTSVTHELFHQFGLQHASAACGGAGVNWPPDQVGYLDGIGLNTTSEPYQFIAAGSPDFSGSVKAQAYDLMSYCAHAGGDDPNTWISPRNWTQLISDFGIDCCLARDVTSSARARTQRVTAPTANATATANADAPLAATASVDPAQLSVTGFVTAGGIWIAHVGPQVGAPLPRGSSADTFTLLARNASGKLLARVPMAATSGGHIDAPLPQLQIIQGARPLVQISAEVPAAGVQSIDVASDGRVVASRTRPARAPRVRVLAPRAGAQVGDTRNVLVRWASSNPEHLVLNAMIDYSRDGGRTWRPIFVGPDSGRASLPRFYFTASRRARIRVRVSDGFNEADALSGVFTALGAPPQVTILTRIAPRLRVPGDARIELTGRAVDQLAQVLSGRSLQWLDGSIVIGAGAAISAGPLPAGVNHIRLLARDPAGRSASATLTVTVDPVDVPFVKLDIPGSVSAGSRVLTFRGIAGIPATLRIGRHSYHIGRNLTVFRLPVGVGYRSLLLQASLTANGVTTPFALLVTRT